MTRQQQRVYLLALCQALFLTCAVASVSVAAIVGSELAPTPWMTTLPYGLQFAVVILCAYPVSRLMGALGRRPVFLMGACFAMAAGVTGYLAIRGGSFSGLILSHVLLGIFITHANYYRFAATDGVEAELRGRAVALVTAGGVLAGILAPLLTLEAGALFEGQSFAHSYLIFSLAGAITFLVMLAVPGLNAGGTAPDAGKVAQAPAVPPAMAGFGAFLAMYCAGAGYMVMNLLMVQSTLALNSGPGSHTLVGVAIQLHVVAMFLPSFFTGRLLERLGHGRVLALGFLLLAFSALTGMPGRAPVFVVPSLILLGVAWNFLYVGGSAFLTLCHSPERAHRIQGINDTVVSGLAAVGALGAGALYHLLGWSGSLVLSLPVAGVGLAMLVYWQRATAASGVRTGEAPES